MRTKSISLAIFLALISVLLISGVSANKGVGFTSVPANTTMQSANNTEWNTVTPSVQVMCVGGNMSYRVMIRAWPWNKTGATVTGLGAVNLTTSTSAITNATLTNFTSVTALRQGKYYLYNVTCSNSSDPDNYNSSDRFFRFQINDDPDFNTSVIDSNVYIRGDKVKFTVTWDDFNATGTDRVAMHVCKTNAFSTTCTGGAWCTNASSKSNHSNCYLETNVTEILTSGDQDFYIYLLDDNGLSEPNSGTAAKYSFSIAGGYYCGDRNCNEPRETQQSCPQDCYCGNGVCEITSGENSQNCPADCKIAVSGEGLEKKYAGVPLIIWIFVGIIIAVGIIYKLARKK